jgi:hypothetical protein
MGLTELAFDGIEQGIEQGWAGWGLGVGWAAFTGGVVDRSGGWAGSWGWEPMERLGGRMCDG